MPPCGNFSHDLLELFGRADFDNIRVVRCTIVNIDPRNNTVDVELGENPPTAPNANELRDTDCEDIPFFEGDGWSDDEQRRRFNAVPIFYHCQKTAGTVNDLRLGHMAFRLPLPELTSPTYTTEEINTRHEQILREKVELIFIPPTAEEIVGGILGHRYVIGHSDRNDIAPCKSEYICIRLIDEFDDDNESSNYGFAVDPSSSIVTIVDPIYQRKYQGLEQYGLTFPCSVQNILDKVAGLDMEVQADVDFLEAFQAIVPLYDNAFVFQSPNNNDGGSVYYVPTCTELLTTRFKCWMSHYFDQHLQAITQADPRDYEEPWRFAEFEEPEPYYSVDHTVRVYYSRRTYGRWPDLSYYTIITGNWYDTTIIQPHYQDTEVLHIRTYQEVFPYALIYLHDVDTREIFLQINSVLPGWLSNISYYDGYHCVYMQWDYLRTIETEWDANVPSEQFTKTDWVNHISQYVPWETDPWYTFEMISTITLNSSSAGTYTGQPGYGTFGFYNYPFFSQSASIIRGRLGMYAMASIFHFTNDGYSAEFIGATTIDSFIQDTSEFVAKTNFAYLPELVYGEVPSGEDYHVSKFIQVQDASDYMDTVLYEMQEMYIAAKHEEGFLDVIGGTVSAFVVDVLED